MSTQAAHADHASPSDAEGIRLAGSGATMFLLPGDNRAKALRRAGGVTQPRILGLWSRLMEHFAPDLILDIGANHGEMSLPQRIGPHARLVLVEPNPDLAGVLARSVATHPDAARFTIREAAVSDTLGHLVLHLDQKWSGTSSLDFRAGDARFKGDGTQSYQEVEVAVTTVDAIVAETNPAPRLLAIKADVEGHEARLVEGAAAALDRPFFMLLEFNAAHLRAAGAKPMRLLDRLHAAGQVIAIGARHLVPLDRGVPLPGGTTDLLVTNVDAVAKASLA